MKGTVAVDTIVVDNLVEVVVVVDTIVVEVVEGCCKMELAGIDNHHSWGFEEKGPGSGKKGRRGGE